MDMGITTLITLIFTAYTCEGLFGEALQLKPSLRENMQIITSVESLPITEISRAICGSLQY